MTKGIVSPQRIEFYTELGKMVCTFNGFTYWLPTFFGIVVGIHPALAMAIVAGEKVEAILKMMRSTGLLRLNNRKLRDEFRDIVKNLGECNERRNHYVHTSWIFVEDPPVLFFGHGVSMKKHKRRAIDFKKEKVDIEDLRKLTQSINDAKLRLFKFLEHFKDLKEQQGYTDYDDKDETPTIRKTHSNEKNTTQTPQKD